MHSREAAIIVRFKRGQTLQEVGNTFEMSRERVRQLLAKHGIKASEGGKALRTRQRLAGRRLTKAR